MQDRNVQYPNRYQLQKVEGTDNIYDLIPAPGTIQNEGTLINKANLLSDNTAEFLGLSPEDDPTVNDAFIACVLTSKNASMVRCAVTVDGAPAIAGIRINGLTDLSGGILYTDESGNAVGLTTSSNTTISSYDYVDLPSVSQSISTPIPGIYSATLALTSSEETQKIYESSKSNIMFSPYVSTADIFAVAGGGSGAAYSMSSVSYIVGATGGAGGCTGTILDADVSNKSISVIVGSGGAYAQTYGNSIDPGNAGGNTSVSIGGQTLLTVAGGDGGYMGQITTSTGVDGASGGSGSGSVGSSVGSAGFNGSDGGNGGSNTTPGQGQGTTTRAFGESGGTLYSGAGGGCTVNYSGSTNTGSGGDGGGGNSSVGYNTSSQVVAFDGTAYGAGGGAAIRVYGSNSSTVKVTSGAGFNGAVFFRWSQNGGAA